MGSTEGQQAGLGDTVRRRRLELGLRQDEAADLAGVSERFVREVEHDKTTLRWDKVVQLLDALGLELRVVLRPSP